MIKRPKKKKAMKVTKAPPKLHWALSIATKKWTAYGGRAKWIISNEGGWHCLIRNGNRHHSARKTDKIPDPTEYLKTMAQKLESE